MLKTDTGILALILPSVVPTAPGNLELRKYLAQRFHIDTIVSSHDPNRIFFSENTSIGEILLVCRRWNGDGPKPPTRVINLARNPATPLEALDTAARVEWASESGELVSHDFTIQRVDPERIARGDWFAVNFLSPFLVDAYRTLSEQQPMSVPTVPLSELADVGPEGRRIRDSYTHSDMPTNSGRRALWYHKTDVTQSMRAETDVYIEPKESKRHLADSYWEQRSRILLPHRLWLPLARVAAVMLPEPAVGSIWTPCRPHDPSISKALWLYLNSTPGLLSLLGARDNRKPSYPSFSPYPAASQEVWGIAVWYGHSTTIYNMYVDGGAHMGAKSHISKWGTSLAVRIPKPIAEQWGVQEGSAIEIVPRGDQVVLRKRSYDLVGMLAQMTPDNLHSEQDSGPAQGNEEW